MRKFKELDWSCPNYAYDQNLLMMFLYDDLYPIFWAKLDAEASGQLSKFPLTQLESKIEGMVNNFL